MKTLFFLSGLPRTGSTFLTSILDQNPYLHTEGNSAVLGIMRKMYREFFSIQQIKANHREKTVCDLISAVPTIYYQDVYKPFVLDKNRMWIGADGWDLIYQFITPYPKVIVLYRPLQEIVRSFLYIRQKNEWGDLKEELLFTPQTDPLMYALQSFKEFSFRKNSPDALFISYEELVNNTKAVISKIYKLFGLPEINHNFDSIFNYHREDDSVYNSIGLHDIRPSISRRDLSDVPLSKATISLCELYEEEYGLKEFLHG